jgi:hypothetical protein
VELREYSEHLRNRVSQKFRLLGLLVSEHTRGGGSSVQVPERAVINLFLGSPACLPYPSHAEREGYQRLGVTMSEDDGNIRHKDIVLGHFGRCWRGECSLLVTFLTGTFVAGLVSVFVFWLEGRAHRAHWSADSLLAVLALGLIGDVLAWGWSGVGLLRCSRRNYHLGRTFWPIVAGIYGGFIIITVGWIVFSVGPRVAVTVISRFTGTYP